MATISSNHTKPLTAGFVSLLVVSLIALSVLNHAANR